MRTRRALLFMPGDDRRKIEKGAALNVDAVIMDLEDGVALNRKALARETSRRRAGRGRFRRDRALGKDQPGWQRLLYRRSVDHRGAS